MSKVSRRLRVRGGTVKEWKIIGDRKGEYFSFMLSRVGYRKEGRIQVRGGRRRRGEGYRRREGT